MSAILTASKMQCVRLLEDAMSLKLNIPVSIWDIDFGSRRGHLLVERRTRRFELVDYRDTWVVFTSEDDQLVAICDEHGTIRVYDDSTTNRPLVCAGTVTRSIVHAVTTS